MKRSPIFSALTAAAISVFAVTPASSQTFDYLEQPDIDAPILNNLAIKDLNAGNAQAALEKLDKAIEIKRSLPEAWSNRCIANIQLNFISRAIADCMQARHLNPNQSEAYYNLAYARAKIGQFSEAIDELKLYIKLKPDDPDPYGALVKYHRYFLEIGRAHV